MADNNIGASRLIGTNGLQQAVDSLTRQVNKISQDFSKFSNSINQMIGTAGQSTGGTMGGNSWNSSSNRSYYSANGGGATYAGLGSRGQAGGRGNGGGGAFTSIAKGFGMSPNGGSRFAGAVGGAAVLAGGLTDYGNKRMSTNMQMDMFNNYAVRAGGIGSGGYAQAFNAANQATFSNNYLGLNPTDMARAGYINTYTSGMSPQVNGGINSNFMRFQAQVQGFGYNSPTQGDTGAAIAAQESSTARAFYMSQAFGIKSTIGPGGVQTPMGEIARSIMQRSLAPGKQYTSQNIAAALGQNGGLGTSLNAMGRAMGWSQGTIQEYRNYMTNLVQAQSKGISANQFDTLLEKARKGDHSAQDQLKAAGIGNTMFESQRNLSSAKTSRQADILEGMSPAFQDATNAITRFTEGINTFLQTTGLGQKFGAASGFTTPIGNALGGFGGAFGVGSGLLTAARLFKGGGGLGSLGNIFRGGAGGAGGLLNATRGANGAFNITSLASKGGGLADFLSGAGKFLGPVGEFFMARDIGKQQDQLIKDRLQKGAQTDPNAQKLLDLMNKNSRTTSTDGRAGGGSDGPRIGGGNANGSVSNNGASAAQILKFAESQLGVPYVWGGTTPGKGLDCSGLVQWAFGQAGVSLPRTSQEQVHSGTAIGINNVQPGDLLFNQDASHVAIALGNGKLIEAPHTGANVRERSYSAGEFSSARRIVGNIGDLKSLLNGNTSGNKNTLNNQQNRSGGNSGSFSGTSEAQAIASALASSIGSLGIGAGSKSASGTSGTSSLGQTPTGSGGNDKASLQAYAKQLLAKYGWGDQWDSFDALVNSESSWDVHATNKSSGAYGLPQALPANKLASAGSDWQSNGQTQLRWMMDYINDRYHSPNAAWSFHQRNNWYNAGAWSIDKDQTATVHQGEMIIPAKQAETIRQALLNNSFNPGAQTKSGGNGGLYIGNITVQLPAGYSGSQQDSYAAGRMIVDAIVRDNRLKDLQRGQ